MTSTTLPLSDGTNITFRSRGEGDPLVLFHGVGMQSAAWEPQLNELSKSHAVYAVDLPGHGGSSPLPDTPVLQDYVSWAVRVLDALSLDRVAVAGHSMGALIALGLSIEYPKRISQTALLNCVYNRSPEASAAVLARAAEIKHDKGDATATLARWFGAEKSEVRDAVAGWLEDVSHQGYAQAYQVFAESDGLYADCIAKISIPVLFLTADGDPNSTPQMSLDMAAKAPLGQSAIVEGHKHMVNLTAPQEVNAILQNWLSGKEHAI